MVNSLCAQAESNIIISNTRFDRLRSLSYAETHLILICFSIARPESLLNVESKWIPEVLHFCPGASIVLVATKCDLREDAVTQRKLQERGYDGCTGYEQGLEVAKRIRAVRYLGESFVHAVTAQTGYANLYTSHT